MAGGFATLAHMSTAFQTLDTPLSSNSPFKRVETLAQLGDMLRNARRAQQKQVATVAADLRLKPAFIEALEQGEWDELPSHTYARGYLRQYAEYLHLPAQEAADCCQRISGKVDSKLHYLAIASTSDKLSKGGFWLSAFAVFFVLAGWAGYKQSASPIMQETIVPPTAFEQGSNSTAMIQLNQTVSATCLNIPHKATLPCYAKTQHAPSLLLKSASIYPIWMR